MTQILTTEWNELADRFGNKTFVPAPIKVGDELGDTVLSVSKGKAALGGVFLALFGSVFVVVGMCIVLGLVHARGGGAGINIVGVIFALAGLVVVIVGGSIAVGALISVRQVRLPMQRQQIVFRMDASGREITVPCSDMEVRLEREGQPTASPDPRNVLKGLKQGMTGRYRLEVVHKSSLDRPVLLGRALKRDDLATAFDVLGRFLGTAVDDSVTQVALPDGQSVPIVADAIGGSSGNFRSCKLVVDSPQLIEIRPTFGWLLFCGVFLVIGLGAMAGTPFMIAKSGSAGMIMSLVGIPFALIGWLGLSGRMGPSRIQFDIARGVMIKTRGKLAVPELATGMPLDRLAALQICSYMVSGGQNSSSYTAYELNVVLRDPAGKRFRIMGDCLYGRLLGQAEQLKELLKLQLVDNT
jgi:hypothetical protein